MCGSWENRGTHTSSHMNERRATVLCRHNKRTMGDDLECLGHSKKREDWGFSGTKCREHIRRLDLGHITKPKPMPSKKDEWALLLELNDLQRENTPMEADEESQHRGSAEEAREEDDDDNFENAEGGEQQSLEEALEAHDLLGDDTPGS